ncbi:UvrD-helicase domain-containing protein [Leptospira alstonii]|uniref:RecBCD enzyme subunit RecB n=2 Tax=Leptospira alstonii TaxID=28452 RepID=M6DCQ7_9LEPT|nr:UvrD-helicase domain-containing protein [Leptospira alstonii]EMJ96355.1 UvrD/REP helicase N-terminal domain protein [Leptospira alstonii serovar Sichuan str. 79601]EQA81691.1 UvrD/REP helicase N-terminal domain protein [Leptospira alstonii serovar Pingchang str. 80-412]
MNVSRPYKLKSGFIEASAGTGKTYTIMEIVGDLILEHKIPLTRILILTYTEKAAGELKERLRKKLIASDLTKEARELDQVTISTIHGFCNMILQEYPVETETPSDWILTDSKERLNEALYRLQHEEWNSWADPKELETFLSASEYISKKENILVAGSKLLSGKKYPYSNETTPMSAETFIQKTALIAVEAVEREFKTSEWMSYDQMILKTRDSLGNPRLRKVLQGRYRVGILDEFQDTDGVQYEIFSRLFLEPSGEGESRALYLIGDPKQSIYGFRGADIGTYLQAKQELKKQDAEEISLNVNYRSVPELIRAYNEIFGGKTGERSFFPIVERGFESTPIEYSEVFAPEKDAKILLSDIHKQGPIQIVRFAGRDTWKTDDARNAWGQFIAEEILKLTNDHDPFSYQVAEEYEAARRFVERKLSFKEIAILVKSKAEGKLAEQSLKLRGIPCSFYKQEGIYQSPESYQISNIFECLLDPNKPSSYRKLLLGDLFQIHPNRLPAFDEHSIDSYEKTTLDRWKTLAIDRKFAELFRSVEEDSRIFLTEDETDIEWERKRTNYRQIFRRLLQFQIANQADLEEILEELKILQTNSKNESELPLFEKETEKDAVQILTLHASKGLEWPVVFLFHLSGNFVPEIYDYPFAEKEGKRSWKLSLWDDEAERKISKEEYSYQSLNESKRLLYVGITRPKARLYLPFYVPTNHKKTRDSAYYKILYPRLQHILENEPDPNLFHSVTWTPVPFDQTDPDVRNFKRDREVHLTPLLHRESEIFKTIRLYSYSSLKTGANVNVPLSAMEEKKPFRSEEDEDSEIEDVLPSSAATGSFLHALLEELDFSFFKTKTPREVLANGKVLSRMDFHLNRFRLSKTNSPFEKETIRKRAGEILWNSLNASIPLGDGSLFKLADLPKENRISEMDFHLNLDAAKKSSGNFLRGSIDLVFQIEDKFYLADYKSNLLEDYSPFSLKRNVENTESRYDLQRDIYAMILYEYLMSLFDPKEALQKIGGVYYFFLRGMKRGDNSGIYSDFHWSSERMETIRKTVRELTEFRREEDL